MRFAVSLCYSVRCLYVILCGFVVLVPPYAPLSIDDAILCISHTLSSSRHLLFYPLGLAVQVLSKSSQIRWYRRVVFKGFWITSGSTTFNYKTRELNACKMAGDTQPRCRVFWVIYKMADLKLGSRLLRDLVKHLHLRDQEFCQISYYSPATGEEIESNSRVMPGPPPLGLNIDRKIPRGKS